MEKIKKEKEDIKKFKEEEYKERKRIKKLQEIELKKDIEDQIKRNLGKSR